MVVWLLSFSCLFLFNKVNWKLKLVCFVHLCKGYSSHLRVWSPTIPEIYLTQFLKIMLYYLSVWFSVLSFNIYICFLHPILNIILFSPSHLVLYAIISRVVLYGTGIVWCGIVVLYVTLACGIVWHREQSFLWKGIIIFFSINLEKRDFFLLDNTLKNKSLKYGRTYSMSSALVSGKEWFAAISKMLFTKTLGLKIMLQKVYS